MLHSRLAAAATAATAAVPLEPPFLSVTHLPSQHQHSPQLQKKQAFRSPSPSAMAALVLLVLISAFLSASDATWCICRSELSSAALQKTLDYACGAGADCGPIHQSGACYNPDTVLAHCSYAANSYFQRKAQAAGSCDFSGSATATATDPSYSGCSYPSTASSAGSNGTSTPGSAGFNPALGPATSTDGSGAGGLPAAGTAALFLAVVLLPALALLGLS